MANNKTNVEVVLGFKANTDQAQKAIRELNNQLNKIQDVNIERLGINSELREAAEAAKILQQNLQAATNVDTGKINITQFSNGLKTAGTSVTELGEKLMGAGTMGQQAFLNLSRSIAQMDVPLKQTNATLNNMLNTLKNTVKWEISSNLVHGIERAFTNAISYAKNLNSSLNDIRIVSGQSVDQMAKFAVEANNAAKALGTTTKSYADAALIYYQQGDSAELAAKKAEITLKATNAAFSATAEEMSQMLTATWNSYQAGTDELEHMVDVMANLGAHTATSLEEIATALQKVAATANTVGVSMEQMSAMISTVSSVTRLAPTVVGTAMNTIMSRMGGLKLGETLEDGVDLNKYSATLKKVGVDVLDATGNLREMGDVVEELGKKWQMLDKGQQSAVAQTIGGTRQYTTMMALFSNWDKYQENLDLAINSDGALEKMQETYMESWEAASKRMKASLETIYGDLINDEGMIKLLNSVTAVINQVENLIKSFGGLPGILLQIGTIAAQVFSNNIAANITKSFTSVKSLISSFKGFNFKDILTTTKEQRLYQQSTGEMNSSIANQRSKFQDGIYSTQLENAQILIEKKKQLIAIESQLSDEEKRHYQVALAGLTQQQNELDKYVAKLKEEEQALSQDRIDLFTSSKATNAAFQAQASGAGGFSDKSMWTHSLLDSANQTFLSDTTFQQNNQAFFGLNFETPIKNITELTDRYIEYNKIIGKTQNLQQLVFNAIAHSDDKDMFIKDLEYIKNIFNSSEFKGTAFEKLGEKIKSLSADDMPKAKADLDEIAKIMEEIEQGQNKNIGKLDSILVRYGYNPQEIEEFKEKCASGASAAVLLKQKMEETGKTAEELGIKTSTTTEAISGLVTAFAAWGRAMSSITNLTSNWNSSNLTSKITSITMGVSGLITVATSLRKVLETIPAISAKVTAASGWIGLAVAAATAIAAIVVGVSQLEQKRYEASAERSTQGFNDYKSQQSNSDNNNTKELVKTYHDLYDEYLKTGTKQEELAETATKLADAYNLLDQKTNITTGNFKAFNTELEKTLSLSGRLAENETESILAGNVIYTKAKSLSRSFQKQRNKVEQNDFLNNVEYESFDAKKYIQAITAQSVYGRDATLFNSAFQGPSLIRALQNDTNFMTLAANNPTLSSIFQDKKKTTLNPEGLREAFANIQNLNTLLNTFRNAQFDITPYLTSGFNYLQENSDEIYFQDGAKVKSAGDILSNLKTNGFSSGGQTFGLKFLGEEYQNFEYTDLSELSPEDAAQKVLDYVDLYNQLKKVVYSKLDDDAKAEYDALMDLLDPIVNDNDLVNAANVVVDNEQLKKIASYKIKGKNGKEQSIEQLINESIVGNIETNLTNTADIYQQLWQQIDSHRQDFHALDGLKQGSQEYNNAIDQIIQQVFADAGEIEEGIDFMVQLSALFGHDIAKKVAKSLPSDVTSYEEFTKKYDLSTYTAFAETGHYTAAALFGEKFKNSQNAIEQSTADYNRYSGISSLIKDVMSPEEITKIQEAYEGIEGFDLEEFLGYGSAKKKKEYLQNIGSGAAAKTVENLKEQSELINNIQNYLKQLGVSEDNPYYQMLEASKQDLKEQIVLWDEISKQQDTILQKYSQISSALSGDLSQTETVKRLREYGVTDFENFDRQAFARQILNDKTLVPEKPGEGATDADWADYNERLKAYNELRGQAVSIINEPEIDKIDRAQNALSALSSDLEKLSKGEGLSTKTKSLLELAGIKDPVTDMASARKVLDQLQTKIQDAMNNIKENGFLDTGWSFDKIASDQDYYLDMLRTFASEGDENAQRALDSYTQYLDYQNQLIENNKTYLETYTYQIDRAVDRLNAHIEELTKNSEKLKSTADIFAGAIQTGELTEEQRTTIDNPDLLEKWDETTKRSDGSIARIQMAMDAYKDYLAQEEKIYTETKGYQTKAQNYADRKRYTTTNYHKAMSDEDFADEIKKMIDSGEISEEIADQFRQAKDKLSKKGEQITWFNLSKEIGDMIDEGEEGLDKLSAYAKDKMKEIWETEGKEHAQAALDAIDAWENAFKKIADLRAKLLGGESIVDDVFGDFDTFIKTLQAYRATEGHANATPADFKNAVLNGTIGANDLKPTGFDIDNIIPKDIVEALSVDNFNLDTARNAVAKHWDMENNAENQQFIDKYLEGYLHDFLSATTDYTENEINVLTSQFLSGEDAAANKMLSAAQLIYEAAQQFGEGVEQANSQKDLAIITENKNEDLDYQINQVRENANKNKEYSDLISSYIENKDTKTLSEILGDKYSEAGIMQDFNSLIAENNKQTNAKGQSAFLGIGIDENTNFEDLSTVQLAEFQAYLDEIYASQMDMIAQAEQEKLDNLTSQYNQTINEQEKEELAKKIKEQEEVVKNATEQANIAEENIMNHYVENMVDGLDIGMKEFLSKSEELNKKAKIDISTDEGKKELYQLTRQVELSKEGFESLQSVTKETWKTLKDSAKKGTKEYDSALRSLKKDMSKMFGVDLKNLSDEFVENHIDDMEKMANGTKEEAMKAQDSIEDDLVAELFKVNGIQPDVQIKTNTGETVSALEYLQNTLDIFDGEEVGFTINANTEGVQADFLNTMTNLIQTGQATVDQINSAFNAIGWEPQIEWDGPYTAEQYSDMEVQGYVFGVDGAVYPFNAHDQGAGAQKIWVPTIKGATKKASPGGGGRKSPSGGGGGKSKNKKVESFKQPTQEKERYHEIRDKLDAQSKVLEKIDKLKDRAFGKHHLEQLNAEIKALEEDLKLQEEYFREASKYYSANLQKLIDAGAKFNEDGTIQYEEFMDRIIHEYNEAVDAFNWSEQTALDEMKLEQAKARYEELTKLLEDYEEDLDLISDIQTAIIEEQNRISAAALEGIQYKIEIKLDLSERDIKILEYFNDKWEELLERQDDRMLNMTKQVSIYETNLTALGMAMRELQAKYNEGVLTEADYAEGMKDINDKILEQLGNIKDVKDSLKELYGNTLELASDKIEKYTSIMQHSRDVMEDYIAMSELMGRGADYAGLEEVYQMQYDSSVTNVEAAKMYLDTLKASRDEIERQVAENGWTEVLQQQWYDVTDAITNGEDELLDQTQQALNDAQAMFENTMQKIIASFDDVLFNMKNGLSQLEDDYNYYSEQQERYLSTSKELYEVAKLNRQIDESIQDATTKTSKERLKALQEVINKQSESTRLTEYDVEMLELQYKHALALQALEEAKNAKSTVRLTRDENGNYGYQYTADDNEIDDARQKVDDALQEINELAANRAAEIEQQVIETERQYRDELLAIAQDTTLTLEERQAKMEELTRRHNETLQFYNEQYTNATSALLTNQEYVYERYGVSIMENTGMVQDQMNATVKAMIDKTSDYASYLEEQMSPGGQIYEALAKYKQDMGIVEGASGLTWSDMTGSIDQYRDANEKAKESITDVNTVLQQTLAGVADVTEQWDKHLAALEKVIAMYEKLGQSAADAVGKVADVEGLFGTAVGGSSGINAQAGVTGLTTKTQWQYTWGPSHGLFGVHSAYDSEAAALAGAKEDIKAQFQNLIQEGEDDEETAENRRRAEAWMADAMKTIDVVSYLSGGLADYTGPAWLDGSKSAPELVLNSRDTANLLSAVDIVRAIDEETLRQISSMMKYSAISAVMGVGNGLSAGGVNPFAQTLDQNVHIEADFPNVTDKNEIIEAFDDLVNLASQYANRG